MKPGRWESLKAKFKRGKEVDANPTQQPKASPVGRKKKEPPPTVPQRFKSTNTGAPKPSDPREQIWDRAYDNLKADEPNLVDAYEVILTRELKLLNASQGEDGREDGIKQGNPDTRRAQMREIIQIGEENAKKEIADKETLEGNSRVLPLLKALVDKAVKGSPAASIVWAGVCLLTPMLKDPLDGAVANRDGIAYVISRVEWYCSLSSLLFGDDHDNKFTDLKGELEKHIVTFYKSLLSYQMRSVCVYYRNPGVGFSRDTAKSDEWESELDALKQAEYCVLKHIETCTSQASISHLTWLPRLAEVAENSHKQLLTEIHQALLDHTAQQNELLDKGYFKDLYITNTYHDKERIRDTQGGLILDASEWILAQEDFVQWHESDESRLLWINGDPGKGKTMLMITTADYLERTRSYRHVRPPLLSYFFCQGIDKSPKTAAGVLRGLMHHLIGKRPKLISILRDGYNHIGSTLFRGQDTFTHLSDIFTKMLQNTSPSTTYLMVDALEECEENLPDLLEFIVHVTRTLRHVKFIVSSRPRRDIEKSLKLGDGISQLSLETAQNAEQLARAVDIYIDEKISGPDNFRDGAEAREQVWGAATGTLLRTLGGDSDPVVSVAFSPGSNLLASGSESGTVRVWEVEADMGGQPMVENGSGEVYKLGFSPDSQLLYSVWNNRVQLRDTVTGTLQRSYEGTEGCIWSVAFSLDSKLLAFGSERGTVAIWDLTTGDLQESLVRHKKDVISVGFAPDMTLAASGSVDGIVKVWDPRSGAVQRSIEVHQGRVRRMAVSPNLKFLVSITADGRACICDLSTGDLKDLVGIHLTGTYSLIEISPDSKLVALTDEKRPIFIYNVTTGGLQEISKPRHMAARSLRFSADATFLRASRDTGEVMVWKMGECVQQPLEERGEGFYCLDASRDWILRAGRKVLWIPPEYRSLVYAISGPINAPSSSTLKIVLVAVVGPGGPKVVGLPASGPHPQLNS